MNAESSFGPIDEQSAQQLKTGLAGREMLGIDPPEPVGLGIAMPHMAQGLDTVHPARIPYLISFWHMDDPVVDFSTRRSEFAVDLSDAVAMCNELVSAGMVIFDVAPALGVDVAALRRAAMVEQFPDSEEIAVNFYL